MRNLATAAVLLPLYRPVSSVVAAVAAAAAMFCVSCSSLALAIPAGARSIFVRVTSTPTSALSKLSAKVNLEGLERMQKARKVRRPSQHLFSVLGQPALCFAPSDPLPLSTRSHLLPQNFLRPSLLRQKSVANALYHKAKLERVKLVEELVLQKSFFPW